MEKYFIIKEDSKFYKDYIDWKANNKITRDLVHGFMNKWGMEAKSYRCTQKTFWIVPTDNDFKKFKSQLRKDRSSDAKSFRKNSVIGKEYIDLMKDHKIIYEPSIGWYVKNFSYGKYRYRIFLYKGILYGSLQADCFELICQQLKKLNPNKRSKSIKVDWNQGLDIRKVDNDVAQLLSGLSRNEYRFAFDTVQMDSVIQNKVELLKRYGINKSRFYMLVGFNTTIFEDFYRLSLLKALGQNAYVMRYRQITSSQPKSLITEENKKLYIAMANWANVSAAFHKISFKQYLSQHARGLRYEKHFADIIDKLSAVV